MSTHPDTIADAALEASIYAARAGGPRDACMSMARELIAEELGIDNARAARLFRRAMVRRGLKSPDPEIREQAARIHFRSQ